MADLAKYIVKLEAQTASYERGLQRANQRLARFESQTKRSLDNVKRSFLQLASGAAVTALGRSVVQAGLQFERIERSLKVATGGAQQAREEFGFITKEANRLGIGLEQAALSYSKLAAASKGTALAGQETRNIFSAVAQASAVLGLSAEQTQGTLTAFEQIISKGKVSAEELRRQLGDRLPGAFPLAAKSIGKTTAELDAMLKKGELLAEDLLPKFTAEIIKTFGGQGFDTAQASLNRLSNAIFELKVAIADSGVLKAVADFAEVLGFLIKQANQTNISEADALGDAIESLSQKASRLKAQIDGLESGTGRSTENSGLLGRLFGKPEDVEALKAQYEAVTQTIADLKNQQLTLLEGNTGAEDVFLGEIQTRHVEEARKRLEDFIKAQREMNANIRTTIGNMRMWAESNKRVAEAMDQIEAASDELDEVFKEADRRQQEAARERERLLEEQRRAVDRLGFTFESAFENAIIEGNKLSDVLKALYKDLQRLILRKTIIEPLAGFISGGISSFLGIPGKASGGPVTGGSPYVVGEKGPELFVPSTSGTIIPNGAGAVSIQQHFTVQAGLPPQWQAQLQTVTQIAATAATDALDRQLAGRR